MYNFSPNKESLIKEKKSTKRKSNIKRKILIVVYINIYYYINKKKKINKKKLIEFFFKEKNTQKEQKRKFLKNCKKPTLFLQFYSIKNSKKISVNLMN